VPELHFSVEGAAAAPSAVTPQLNLHLRVSNGQEPIHSALLRCQVMIEAARRRYSPQEVARLRDLFGERERWGETLRALVWSHVTILVPAFSESTVVDVPLVCSIDVTQGPAKYLFALETGVVPLTLLFSGTVFHPAPAGGLHVTQVPWSSEARATVPVPLVNEIAARHHGGAAFLALAREVFDRLQAYRTERGHPSWEHTIESLLGNRSAA
jgi:hypothetical protein